METFNIAAMLHLMICSKKHSSTIEDIKKNDTGLCNWYMEEQLENSWDHMDHQQWIAKAENIAKLSGNISNEDLFIILTKIMKAVGIIDSLCFTYGPLREVIKTITKSSLEKGD